MSCSNITVKNHIAKNGQKGICVFNFFHLFFSLALTSIIIPIILQARYVTKAQGIVKDDHIKSHTSIAILKSHHPRAAHFDITICKKKNTNNHKAQSNADIAGKDVRDTPLVKYISKKYNQNHIAISIKKSQISFSDFSIIA